VLVGGIANHERHAFFGMAWHNGQADQQQRIGEGGNAHGVRRHRKFRREHSYTSSDAAEGRVHHPAATTNKQDQLLSSLTWSRGGQRNILSLGLGSPDSENSIPEGASCISPGKEEVGNDDGQQQCRGPTSEIEAGGAGSTMSYVPGSAANRIACDQKHSEEVEYGSDYPLPYGSGTNRVSHGYH
jgi:hypothetical protein